MDTSYARLEKGGRDFSGCAARNTRTRASCSLAVSDAVMSSKRSSMKTSNAL